MFGTITWRCPYCWHVNHVECEEDTFFWEIECKGCHRTLSFKPVIENSTSLPRAKQEDIV